jgi:RNA polymerase-associated protein LEO1
MPPPPNSQNPLRSHGLTYLVAQHKRAEVLQAEKVITGHLTLRPTGMQSETHRKLVRAVGQKHNKVARLRMAPSDLVRKDPDKELAELAKNAARKPRKSNKKAEDGLVTAKKRRAGVGKKSREHVWSDDEGEAFMGSEDDSEDGLDGKRKVKKKPAPDELKKGPGEYQTDDFVVSDEGDDEDGTKGGKRQADDEEQVKDSLDEAEAKIAKQESKKRKKGHVKEEEAAPTGGDAEDDTDDKMEVESEEDDQEVGIRRPLTGGRRRRVAVKDEDDDE